MSDIVERLRAHSNAFNAMSNADWMEIADASLKDAAARIEQLEAALRPFAWYAENLVPQIDKICGDGFYKALQDARAALEEKP